MKVADAEIVVVRASVTDQQTDAIVNAANKTMRGGGGIDGRIHSLAGKGLMRELEHVAPHGAETSEAVVTGGHQLSQKHIVHVAGPRYRDGKHGEPKQLADAYYNSLAAADKLKLESVAFCSISTGVYGYPLEDAAAIALQSVVKFIEDHPNSTVDRIVFAMYSEKEFETFDRLLKKMENGN